MFEIRSVSGAYLRHILSVNYPSQYATAIPQMARELGISKRSLYAYIQEERRVPEPVERRLQERYGVIPEAGWRVVTAQWIRRAPEAEGEAPFVAQPEALDLEVGVDASWTEIAKASVTAVAVKLHGHEMGEWVGNPEMLDADGNPLDLVSECSRCGMLVAIDAGLKEVNGFAWRAFCGSDNLWRGAR